MKPSVKKISRRHAKRWAYSKTLSVLDNAMSEGWPNFEGYLHETTGKLNQALKEVRDGLAMKGLLETDPDILKDQRES